ncbi:MAG: glutathione peroxidase [Acidobacteriota bacterium]
MPSLYEIPLTTLDGRPSSLADYSGKPLLLVNVASKCGLTPQYTALEALYQRFKDRGLIVLGFPANDFAGQEPGTNEEIAKFCSIDYPVSFPLFAKIPVTGPDKHPLYAELIQQAPTHIVHGPWREGLTKYAAANGYPPPNELPELLWNFEKFLIGRDGNVLARFAPDTPPDDPKLVAAIEQAL